MRLVDGNIIDFALEERDVGLYDVKMSFNGIPYIAVYSVYVGFIYASLEDEDTLEIIGAEIKKVLKEI